MSASVTAHVFCEPSRYNYAAESLRCQHSYQGEIQIVSHLEKWPVTKPRVHPSIKLAELYSEASVNCKTDYLILACGDTELPTDFVRCAFQSGADVYGVPLLEQECTRQFNLISGSMRNKPFLTYGSWAETDVYPENVAFVRTSLAQHFKWTAHCDMPLPAPIDHFYPFMQWADRQGAKIVVDHSLIGIHHKE